MEENKAEELKKRLGDVDYRLSNLYWIQDKRGHWVKFSMNRAQRRMLSRAHTFNCILKARQLGFSTLIAILFLDAALFNSGQTYGIIDATAADASKKLDKIKNAYERLPDWLKQSRQVVTSNSTDFVLSNGSAIYAGVSHRGGTLQKLHVSEFGKIAAKFPDKAAEVITGAFPAVPMGGQIFVESTAEGQFGAFFDIVKRARKLADTGEELTDRDPMFHFFPWYDDPAYTLETPVVIGDEMEAYFAKLGVALTDGQKWWYAKMAEEQGEYMHREYPSTPDEAFAASAEGAFYTAQMRKVRQNGQICHVPHDSRYPVNTYWDIGNRDYMGIWFVQHIAGQRRVIRYLQRNDTDLRDYAEILKSYGYQYGKHHLPHDGDVVRLGVENRSVRQSLEALGFRNIVVVARTTSVRSDIESKVKPVIEQCWFDEKLCADGVLCLDNYRKKWNKSLGMFMDEPLHDQHSHGADAFRTYACAEETYALPKAREVFAGRERKQDNWMDW